MFCLLCHEKISRLRAWRTKSEFCSDEHAEIYKRQTLERLLTDHDNNKPAEAPPLPVDTSPPGKTRAEEKTAASEVLARFAEQDAAAVSKQRPEPPTKAEPFENAGRDEGLQELWRLAEEVNPAAADGDDDGWDSATARLAEVSAGSRPGGGFGGLDAGVGSSLGSLGKGLGSGAGNVREQTPEEALAALRELSSGPRRATSIEEPSDELDSLLSARGFDATARRELELSTTGDDLPGSLDDVLGREDSLPPLDGSLELLGDDELPAILDRLTEPAPEPDQAELAAARPAVEFAEELLPPAALAEEIGAELNLPTVESAAAQPEHDDANTSEQVEQISAAKTDSLATETRSDDLGAFDLLEEAVESHLEELQEPASQRGSSHKVVPFPLSRPKTLSRDEFEETEPASQPAASATGDRKSVV